jgi:polysaccharide export outer membrane protein
VAGAAARAQSAADYVIGPQDVLTIQVFDQADLGGKYTVETDGTFSFPLIGRVQAAGMTLRAFEASSARSWRTGTSRTRRSPWRSSSTAASGSS